MKKRRLFCELSPLAYRISVKKCRMLRHINNILSSEHLAKERSEERLDCLVYQNRSLMRRLLGNVEPLLQENKVVNLGIAAPKVSGILIKPGETFSFWKLVGSTTSKKGYLTGLILSRGQTDKGIGGGLCQFTNLIHWLVLHSPLDIVEHHHHDGVDMFPDNGRVIPFGTGTSIFYNYLDYRFKNNTDKTFQLIVYLTDTHLCGELRCNAPLDTSYHIRVEGERFVRRADAVYRMGRVYRDTVDKRTGNVIATSLIKENNARLMYEASGISVESEDVI